MCHASPYYHVLGRNPLNGLGLFLKHDDDEDIDEDNHEEEIMLHGEYTTNKSKSKSKAFKFHNGQGNQTSSIQLSSKQAARVSILKTQFMDVIFKSQQLLGLLGCIIQDLKKQKQSIINNGSFKKSTRQYCKSKSTINAKMPSATVAFKKSFCVFPMLIYYGMQQRTLSNCVGFCHCIFTSIIMNTYSNLIFKFIH